MMTDISSRANGTTHVIHIISGLNSGGAEAVLYRLCIGCNSQQHTVISLMDEGKYALLLREAGIQVYCLNMPRGKVSLSGLAQLWRILWTNKPQIVQTWMYHADLLGGIIARLAGVERVFWGIRRSTLNTGKAKRMTVVIAKLCAKLSHWLPTRIICCAEEAKQVHARLGYAKDKMIVIPNGYDISCFIPDEEAKKRLRVQWNIPEQIPLIGLVGRFDPAKDHSNLISALGQLKRLGFHFKCVLVGNGISEHNEKLISWLQEHDVNDCVLLEGQRDDIYDVMNALDLHVLSSVTEGFPNVLCEAMACGTPCVTTDVGDAARIVGSTGWVVPACDANALSHAITEAITEKRNDPNAWETRRKRARDRIVENFDLNKMVAAYRTAWKQEH